MPVVFPHSVCKRFRLFWPPKRNPGGLSWVPWEQDGRLSFECNDPPPSHPAVPRPAPPRRTLPRPPRRCAPPGPAPPMVCPGFGIVNIFYWAASIIAIAAKKRRLMLPQINRHYSTGHGPVLVVDLTCSLIEPLWQLPFNFVSKDIFILHRNANPRLL